MTRPGVHRAWLRLKLGTQARARGSWTVKANKGDKYLRRDNRQIAKAGPAATAEMRKTCEWRGEPPDHIHRVATTAA